MFKHVLASILLLIVAGVPAFASDFTVTSTDIAEGRPLDQAFVFNGFGCEGDNQSPQLSWRNAPRGTKSFVVTAYDPDAPTGSGWWHWVAFNIPAEVRSLDTNASANSGMPMASIQARSDFGSNQYGGACPPAGEVHRYVFTVYALGVAKLDLDATASPALIGFMTKANALGSDSITAIYTRCDRKRHHDWYYDEGHCAGQRLHHGDLYKRLNHRDLHPLARW